MRPIDLWRSRAPRERRVLAIGATAAALLLFVALVWLPVQRTHTRLERELPAVRASITALERQADEVRRLRALPAAASAANPGALPPLAGAQVSTPAPGRVHVIAGDVGFNALLDWIAAAEAAQGLHVEAAHLEALPTAGRVSADLTLARS